LHSGVLLAHYCPDGACTLDNPADIPAFDLGDEDDTIVMCCPGLLIPNNVIEWYKQLKYEERFGTGIHYGKRSARFIAAMSVYDYYMMYWNNYKTPQRQTSAQKVAKAWQAKK